MGWKTLGRIGGLGLVCLATFSCTQTARPSAVTQPAAPATQAAADDMPAALAADAPVIASLSSSLVSWWPLEGHLWDVVGTNHGEAHGGAAFVPGLHGLGLSCPENQGYVDVGANHDLDPSRFCIAAWVLPNRLDQGAPSIYSDHLHGQFMTSIGLSFGMFEMCSGPGGSNQFITRWKGEAGWNHLAVSGDAESCAIYVNGTLRQAMTKHGDPWASTASFNIGGSPSILRPPAIGCFQGVINDVMVFGRSLSPREVATLTRVGGPTPQTAARQRAAPLSAETFASLWEDLRPTPAPRAYYAAWRLCASGDAAVDRIADSLRHPRKETPHDDTAALIARLDDDQWSAREAATQALKARASLVRGQLQDALAANPSAEMAYRLRLILDAIPTTSRALTDQQARGIRAVLVLARIGSPAAQKALAALAAGLDAGPVQVAAAAALDRPTER